MSENLAAVKEQLQNLYKQAIESHLGAIANIDADGDINFKYGALGVLILPIDAGDPSYCRLIDQMKIGAWNAESEIKALKAANIVNLQVKCITQSISKVEDDLILMNAIEAYVSIEGQIPAVEFVESALKRYAEILDAGRDLFTQNYEQAKD